MEERKAKYCAKLPLYYWVLVGALGLHVIFEFMFIYLGNQIMIGYNAFSILVYGLGVLYIRKNQMLTVLICFLEATVFITVSTIQMGWSYGFQNSFFAFAVLCITVPFAKRRIFYVLGICQAVLYIFLYYWVNVRFRMDGMSNVEAIFVSMNLLFVFCLIFLTERVLKISKAMEQLFWKHEVQEMEQIAAVDELTGLTTRRKMNCILTELNNLWHKQALNFYLVFADLDNFKRINDTYGHLFGDQVLEKISEILNRELRGDDIIARWGGEEFLILLQNKKFPDEKLSPQKVHEILERVRRKVEETPIPYGNENVYVTITLGGVNSERFKDVYQMVREADVQMYQGKRNGRNCVVVK